MFPIIKLFSCQMSNGMNGMALLQSLVMLITLILLASGSIRQKVIVVGGSGRVGGSAVRALYNRFGSTIDLSVGGRRIEAWESYQNRLGSVLPVNFVPIDIYSIADLDRLIPQYDIIVNTAGPFQGLSELPILESAIKYGKKYVDVCDDIRLSRICRSSSYRIAAEKSGASAIISAGIWPGGSSVFAQDLIRSVGGAENVEKVIFSFFTAGSGNAGPTILTATFLILGENVLTYKNGAQKFEKSAANPRLVDFGQGIGEREVVRLNLIECESCFCSGIKNVETYFGTAPAFWNKLFALMANIIPQKALQSRFLMTLFAQASLPMVRLIDSFVGSKNGIRVDLVTKAGETATGLLTHQDLEKSVGDALAAFVAQMMTDNVPPGVHFPEEVDSEEFRKQIMRDISSDAITYSMTTSQR